MIRFVFALRLVCALAPGFDHLFGFLSLFKRSCSSPLNCWFGILRRGPTIVQLRAAESDWPFTFYDVIHDNVPLGSFECSVEHSHHRPSSKHQALVSNQPQCPNRLVSQ